MYLGNCAFNRDANKSIVGKPKKRQISTKQSCGNDHSMCGFIDLEAKSAFPLEIPRMCEMVIQKSLSDVNFQIQRAIWSLYKWVIPPIFCT